MRRHQPAQHFDFRELGRGLQSLGQAGITESPSDGLCDALSNLNLIERDANDTLVATNRLFTLGPTRTVNSAIRRVLSFQPDYRSHLLTLLLEAVKELADDQSLAETVERLDHLSPEVLQLAKAPSPQRDMTNQFDAWDTSIWQAPDAVTLLSKVVETPADFAVLPGGSIIAVGFDWLSWETPPIIAAPAPWGDSQPLKSPLATAQHPFWGAMVATLDACTGDYEWQSLILRGGLLRSQHRTLGKAEAVMESLWRHELGLYPAPPLIVPEGIAFTPGKPLHWLSWALEHLTESGIAIESEGSWRLTDHFRTQLMKDDEHMMAFEGVRQRSYQLARAAVTITELTNEVVAS